MASLMSGDSCHVVEDEPCCHPIVDDNESTEIEAKEPKKNRVKQSIHKSFFILGGVIIIFAAIRNTLTWHLQKCWGASGDFWQALWVKVFDYFEGDAFIIGFIGTNLVACITFWALNAFFLFMDITGRPAFLRRYKIQEGKNDPVSRPQLMKALKVVLFNQFVVTSMYSLLCMPIVQWRGDCILRELPTVHWVLVELAVFLIFEEIGFYYSHRMLHHPMFYKHIHKLHHEWTSPIGLTAIYAHPVEHVLSSLIPATLGPIIMGSHIATIWMWFVMVISSAVNAHCGYHLPFFPSPEAHDFHHLKFTNCFGTLGILDRLHGTDILFRKSKQYDRHILLTSLTPLSSTFPDSPKRSK
ncbi:fatty acid hydroxylase domain-containing protein 2-like [Anneissia japonica]|uniref:fatty acid hydroxylase domain-containing protein 2-like n=1 Tax=Anneissia japonica TaxID=1529436 RepID=UPI0014258EF4|nr:fatty acid hydroxylase domain-containing protein 2-like [Anneissia japonica]